MIRTGNKNQREGPVSAELLLSELRGKIEATDYFARSTTVLENIEIRIENEGNFKASDAVDIDHMNVLIQPGYLSLENGYVRREDGSVYVAVYLDLGYEVNGEMIDWWFGQCDNDEKIKWIHPKNNIFNTYDSPFFAAMPFERPYGHYVNHLQIRELAISTHPALVQTHHTAGNTTTTSTPSPNTPATDPSTAATTTSTNTIAPPPKAQYHQTLQFEYIRASKYFDVSKFPEYGITACIVAKVYTTDPFLGSIAVGFVTYIVREVNGRSELRMRFWYGEYYYQETPETYLYAKLMNYLTSFPVYRARVCPLSIAKAFHTHFTEEMTCLREILPTYFKDSAETNRQFQRTFNFATN